MNGAGDIFASSDLHKHSSQAQGTDEVFDGKHLCLAARDELEKTHRQLTDPTKRTAFDKMWSRACQSDPRTASESGSDEMVQEMLSSMGERFDHYFDRQGYINLKNEQSGADIGLGIETEINGAGQLRTPQPYEAQISQDHPLVVRAVTPDSPAARAGILVGDQILAIDGLTTAGLKRRDALAEIQGKRDVQVHLQISRPLPDGTFAPQEIDATETLIKVPAAAYKNIDDGVGYIKLRNFMDDNAESEMLAALNQAVHDRAMVIDLRNNNGGRVGTMEHIAEQILEKGELLRTESRDGDGLKIEVRYIDNEGAVQVVTMGANPHSHRYPRWAEAIVPKNEPIVILVDEYSSSAAEILAGALHANERP